MENETTVSRRGQWSRHLEFLLTLIGYAVGLGNVWRFPYLCYKNGGGAFLLPYTFCLVLLGIPVFALETSFGQYGGRGSTSNWNINPAFKGVGIAMLLINLMIIPYYGVVIGWGVYYLIVSFTAELPWSRCSNCSCLLFENQNLTLDEIFNETGRNCSLYNGPKRPATEYYFQSVVLGVTDNVEEGFREISWHLALCSLLGWVVVFLTLCKGIKSLGKVVYFTSIMPYVIVTALLVHGLQLEGALRGVEFYITPDFSKLMDFSIWSDAAAQIFFSLSTGLGGLITFASYNNFHNNILRDAMVVPIINCLTSIFAGFVVFAALGHMASMQHVAVNHVIENGPGLAFVVYPAALSSMSLPVVWSILFFLLFCLLGLSSQFTLVETLITAALDEFPMLTHSTSRKTLCRVTICCLGFLLGLPFLTQSGHRLLDLVDNTVVNLPVLVVCFLELVAIIHIYGYRNFARDVTCMTGIRPTLLMPCWTFISPAIILTLMVVSCLQYRMWSSRGYPWWSDFLAWSIVGTPIACIPLYFVYSVCVTPRIASHTCCQHIKKCNQSLPEYQQKRIEQFRIGSSQLAPRPSSQQRKQRQLEPIVELSDFQQSDYRHDENDDDIYVNAKYNSSNQPLV